MNTHTLICCIFGLIGSTLATAHPYIRYENDVTKALEAEAANSTNPNRVSVGDNPANAVYWTGEQAIPAEQVADLLQLSLANGHTTAEQWFTSPSGKFIVFMAEPGCGAAHHVFTVFGLKTQGKQRSYQKMGTYHFITRYLNFCPAEIKIDDSTHSLTVVYSTKNGNMRIEKSFSFINNPEETCRAFDTPEEEADLGNDSYGKNKPLRMHGNGLATRQPLCHAMGRSFREIDSIDFESLRDFLWTVELDQRGDSILQKKEIDEQMLFLLYAVHRYNDRRSSWIADEKGDTFALIQEHASGCLNYTLRLYRRSAQNPKVFVHLDNVGLGSRYLDWDIAASRFEEDGLYVELGGNGYKERKSAKILYSNPQSFFYRITPGDEPQ